MNREDRHATVHGPQHPTDPVSDVTEPAPPATIPARGGKGEALAGARLERKEIDDVIEPEGPSGSPAYTPALPGRRTESSRRCAEGVGTVDGPPLSGQPAPYLAQQLRDWQVSKRRNDGHHAMLKVAQRLKPDEITQLSLYLARLPPRQAPAAR